MRIRLAAADSDLTTCTSGHAVWLEISASSEQYQLTKHKGWILSSLHALLRVASPITTCPAAIHFPDFTASGHSIVISISSWNLQALDMTVVPVATFRVLSVCLVVGIFTLCARTWPIVRICLLEPCPEQRSNASNIPEDALCSLCELEPHPKSPNGCLARVNWCWRYLICLSLRLTICFNVLTLRGSMSPLFHGIRICPGSTMAWASGTATMAPSMAQSSQNCSAATCA